MFDRASSMYVRQYRNQRDATITVLFIYEGSCLTSVRQLPSYCTRSATLPRSKPLPTTTTGHYTICCKKTSVLRSWRWANFSRNMLSWSWRSMKLLLLHLVGFYIALPTLMMHGQTQIISTVNSSKDVSFLLVSNESFFIQGDHELAIIC